jgi:hypothetical protein
MKKKPSSIQREPIYNDEGVLSEDPIYATVIPKNQRNESNLAS